MNVRISTIYLSAFFALVPLKPSEDPNQRQWPSPPETTSHESNSDSLSKVLLKIQAELKQIAEDINTIDAKLLQSRNGGNQATPISSKVHELLKSDDPATFTSNFPHSSQDRLLWESCLRSGRLYTNLAAEVFVSQKTRPPESGQQTGQLILGDEFDQTAQLVFLSRMIPELGILYGEVQSQAIPNTEPAEPWHKLREALRHDDQLWLEKLIEALSSAGQSPHQFATRVLSEAQKTSPSAASTIAESMWLLDPGGDVWKLSEVREINPAFLRALECETQLMKSARTAGSQTGFLHAFDCRRSADGSSLQAFTGPDTHPVQPGEKRSNSAVSRPNESPQGRDIFRLPTAKELQDLQSQDSNVDTPLTTPSQPPTFGVSNTPVKRPKIPSWWIRCACPSDHPDAGMVVEGVRWHAPVLQCPNPELKRLEVK